MSLTSHLESKTSPVRAWMLENFPGTRRVTTAANRELRDGAAECSIPRLEGADPGLVGTAVDYLLRACLRVTSIESTAASKAVGALSSDPRIGLRAIEIEREVVADIKKLRPSRRDLTDGEWTELCIRCLVLARFEQFYRAGPVSRVIFELLVQPLRKCTGLNDFIPLALTQATIEDLARLGRAVWEDQRSLQKARPLVLNPQFQMSADLGGADADLIARHKLIDWKATTQAGIIGRQELWQLLGYALADTQDEYDIREVGISALRWRKTINWPLKELLDDLVPGPPVNLVLASGGIVKREPIDLQALRYEFAQLVTQACQVERERNDAWLSKREEIRAKNRAARLKGGSAKRAALSGRPENP
ncbi:MAG: hypothetical protein WB507_06180 [Solirubrobacterales bacterium]